MFKRHFFLVGALVVLVVMVLAGGFKLMTVKKAGAGGAGGPPGASARGPGGPGGARGGAAGRGGPGGFGGGPTMVSVAQARQTTFTDAIEVLGVAKGRRSVTLTSSAAQLVQRVRFTDGQTVPAGAVLVELKTAEQGAGVAQAQANLVVAKRTYDRYQTLSQQGFASKAQLDQYEAAWRSAQADLAVARARESDRMIRAPFAGVVGLSDVAPGALVNPGSPIVTLDDLSSVRVDFPVPERYLAQLHPGQTIAASVDAYPGQTFDGRIANLDTRVDERTRAITARAEFANPGRKLKPGMMIRVAISRGVRQGLAIPESALSVQGDSAFVYVLHAQGQRTMTEQRPVITGLRQNGVVEITDGLTGDERLVADGLNKIQPGQPVRIAGQRPAPGASGVGQGQRGAAPGRAPQRRPPA